MSEKLFKAVNKKTGAVVNFNLEDIWCGFKGFGDGGILSLWLDENQEASLSIERDCSSEFYTDMKDLLKDWEVTTAYNAKLC